ncbi:hypothetical protein GTA08_BOTSDO08057 [Botryosphaeria dothidea]|uniref:F-box domain-containing protein n=1 Tax=Botryosphaeria dothidea TaxID=55169 RepID=A0A8H4IN88_9PEZI|nr:hypothetical protein GTA08_BOTSDO08057 [Botryosphaeria dothidea]
MTRRTQLTSLPSELLELIFMNLPTPSMLSVALTCHTLYSAAVFCLESTIVIHPAIGSESKSYSPDPYTLALRLISDPTFGTRVRHLTFSNISPDNTTALSPRRGLPILATRNNATFPRKANSIASHTIRAHVGSPRLHPHHSKCHRLNWSQSLRSGVAQYHVAALLSLTPDLRTLDLTWAGLGKWAPFAGPGWLRTALPRLELLVLRACGKRGCNGSRGWFDGEEWRFPEWAVRGALAAGHPALRSVVLRDGRAAELQHLEDAAWDAVAAASPAEVREAARALGDGEGWKGWMAGGDVAHNPAVVQSVGRVLGERPATPLRALELRKCAMMPAQLAEVLVLTERGCPGLAELVVDLVHPVTRDSYTRQKTIIRLDELGDALRRLLRDSSGCEEWGKPMTNKTLSTMRMTLDFVTPKGDIARAKGGEVGTNGVKWGISGRIGSLRGFEALEWLEVSWVTLVGLSSGSLQRENPEYETCMVSGGYLGSVFPQGLRWLTISDEMANWQTWEWSPEEVLEM